MAPELAIFQAVVRWKEHNEKRVEELAQVLEHIRLSEFFPQEIFNEVEPTKLFSQESILTALRLQFRPSVADRHPRGKKGVYVYCVVNLLYFLLLVLMCGVYCVGGHIVVGWVERQTQKWHAWQLN